MRDFHILAIETSCDETSAAVIVNGRKILSNIISTQIDLHKEYGGVVPEIASRLHVEFVYPVIEKSLSEAGLTLSDIDAFATTNGPGLVGALLVGVSAAKAMAFATRKPLIPVNHIEGHIAANYLSHPELKPPYLCLVVSGGHSHIILVEDYTKYSVIGRTRDDAAGEAFDKIARVLGLGYPGGPAVDKAAREGNSTAFKFPRVQMDNAPYDFSFSGLKTSVIQMVQKQQKMGNEISTADICASFQSAVIDVLVDKTLTAAVDFQYDTICMAGGVASNRLLREMMGIKAAHKKIRVLYPEPVLCTDNAAMIGSAAYFNMLEGFVADYTLNAIPSLKIGEKNSVFCQNCG
jgi:N6-L-threonylcarbamoyladenine synthase